MNNDDFTYGCRSGIQKAIRRGNLNLCRTCFETLWEDKSQRQWLKWRLPVLVAEEAWYFAGELGEFMASNPEDNKKAWQKFLYRLTIIPKSKDADGLYVCTANDLPPEQEDNFGEMTHAERMWMSSAIEMAGDDPPSVIREIYTKLDENAEFDDYEKLGIQQMISRSFAGGMQGDKWILLASVILHAFRRVDQDKIKLLEEKGLKQWHKSNGKGKPKRINLPWYVFDMHTQLGKIASSIFMKRKAKDFAIAEKDDFHDIWFVLESGFVPKEMQRASTVDDEEIAFYESFWWPIAINVLLDKVPGMGGANEVIKLWPRIKKEIIGIIGWLQEKRGKGD